METCELRVASFHLAPSGRVGIAKVPDAISGLTSTRLARAGPGRRLAPPITHTGRWGSAGCAGQVSALRGCQRAAHLWPYQALAGDDDAVRPGSGRKRGGNESRSCGP